jgi:hypothetical protein
VGVPAAPARNKFLHTSKVTVFGTKYLSEGGDFFVPTFTEDGCSSIYILEADFSVHSFFAETGLKETADD